MKKQIRTNVASHYIVSTVHGVAAVEKLRPFLRAHFPGITDVEMNKIAQGVRAVSDPVAAPFVYQGTTIVRHTDDSLYKKVSDAINNTERHPLSTDAIFFARLQGRTCIH